MTLGRTSTGAIKIKTDTEGGGLRAVECECCGECPTLDDALKEQIFAIITNRKSDGKKCSYKPRARPPWLAEPDCPTRIYDLIENSQYTYWANLFFSKYDDFSDKPAGAGGLSGGYGPPGRLWSKHLNSGGSCLKFLYRNVLILNDTKKVLNDIEEGQGQLFGGTVFGNRKIWDEICKPLADEHETESGCYLYLVVFFGWHSNTSIIPNPDSEEDYGEGWVPYLIQGGRPYLFVPSSRTYAIQRFQIKPRRKEGDVWAEYPLQNW
jgi:hypothetical protein